MGVRSIYAFAGLNLAVAAIVAWGAHWSASAAATTPQPNDWVKVSENETFVFYMEPLPVESDDSVRRVWEMFDLKQEHAGHEGEASIRSLNEYDCRAERYRILKASGHSGPMATGQTLWNRSNVGDWAVPGESIFNRVCAARDRQWV